MKLLLALIVLALFGTACSKGKDKTRDILVSPYPIKEVLKSNDFSDLKLGTLPKDIKWITNDKDPIFSSSEAKTGGTFREAIGSFPLTLRYIGPDSNGGFRGYLDELRFGLTARHPNTRNVIPVIATHWAYGKDQKSLYYKLNPKARWSDGQPITADDFIFALKLMRSKFIVAPWYNNYYSEYIKEIVKFDDYTIQVVGNKKQPKDELHEYYNLAPEPRHFFKLTKNWVKDYNWKAAPMAGPYQISRLKKGKYIEFKKVANWWAQDLKYYKYRYNVEKVRINIIRDQNVTYEYFKKGKVDSFSLTIPDYWYNKATGEIYDKGYVNKIWFYNDVPRPDYGIWFNMDKPLFKDKNVRFGVAHSFNIGKIIKSVLRNDYERLHTDAAGKGKYENKKIRTRQFDLKKADFYFKKAGFSKFGPDGIRVKGDQRLSFEITYGYPHHTDRLVVLKEEARKAGVEIKLNLLDGATSFKKTLEKKHEVVWMGWGSSSIPSYWQSYHSDNAHKVQTNNISNTDDKKMDTLINAFRNEFNQEKKYKLAHKIQQRIHEIGAYVPTFLTPYFRQAYWRYWRFPKVPATMQSEGVFEVFKFGLFWLDEKLKDETMAAKKSGKSFGPTVVIDKTFKNKE